MNEVLKIQNINLDLKRVTAQAQSIAPLKVEDNGNVFVISLTDDGVAVDLTDTRVIAVFSRADGKTAQQDTDNGLTVEGNKITVRLRTSSFADGQNNCEIQVYSGEDHKVLVTSANFNFDGKRGIMNDETVKADDNFPILVSLIADVDEAVRRSETAVDGAESAVVRAEEAVAKAETIAGLARYTFNDVSVAAAEFASNEQHADYPYRAEVALEGIEEKMLPEVTFSIEDAALGIFAPTTDAYDGGIYLYASTIPQEDIVIPTIVVWV